MLAQLLRNKTGMFHFFVVALWFAFNAFPAAAQRNGVTVFGKDAANGKLVEPFQTVAGTTIRTIVGTGTPGSIGDNGSSLAARLNAPQDVILHPDNTRILIADLNNHRVRQVNLNTGIITTFAGNGDNAATGNVGPAANAAVAAPRSLAVDVNGNVYIGTLHQIRVVNSSGIIDLFAGSVAGDSGNAVPAREAQFRTVGGMAIDIDGGLLFADIQNNKIRKVRVDGTVVTIAGDGTSGRAGDGGPPTSAQLENPVDVKVGPFGTVYIAERLGGRIRVIKNGIISTLVDKAVDSTLAGIRGLATFRDYFLYFSTDNHRIRRMNLFDQTIEVVAGTGSAGYNGDGSNAANAMLNQPVGISTDRNGNLFVADSSNNVIRFVSIPPADIPPTPAPTNTPTPTPTRTPIPTNTPTITPRVRTPSPTVTPHLTATATATPTGLIEGQLAPSIPAGTSLSANFVFYTAEQTSVYIPSATNTGQVRVVLASTADGKGPILTADTIRLQVTNPVGTRLSRNIVFQTAGTTLAPQDITPLFAKGRNLVDAQLVDAKGTGFSSSPLYVVVYSAPVLSDIPDLRALVGESIQNAISLEDYFTDRDTPIQDVTWTITAPNNGPKVLQGPGQTISVEPMNTPMSGTFTVQVSDGIFSASELVNVKFSSFQFDRFQLNDAAIVDDFAYVSPSNFQFNMLPQGVNLSNVPFDATFTQGSGGIRAAQAAHGNIYLFPEFPGGTVKQPVDVSFVGHRQSNLNDYDGMIVKSSSVVPPGDGSADRNYNFSAVSLSQTNWSLTSPENVPIGEVQLGSIPFDPVPAITDGYGAIVKVDAGETATLFSKTITLPTGPATISMWFAVEKVSGNPDEMPTVTIALAENSNNLSLSTVRGAEILGKSEYQFLSTSYDVIDPNTFALIQISGTQSSGRAEVYIDNVRVFPMPRDIDRALGETRIPTDFDGTFESVLRGLGLLVSINPDPSVTVGAQAFVSASANHQVIPGGLKQALILDLVEPTSGIQVEIGPNAIDHSLYPRFLSARAHVQVVKEGGGAFAFGITNGLQDAVTYISNDRLPLDRDTWHTITATGLFSKPGPIDPVIILQNKNSRGLVPGLFGDGASLAVDDITIEAFQDSKNLWDKKRLPRLK